MMWTLRVRGPKGAAATVQIESGADMKEFCELVVDKLGIKSKKQPLTFRCGFPPRPVEYAPTNLLSFVFTNNDTIVVDTTAPTAVPHQAVAPPKPTRSAAASRTPAKSTAQAKAKSPAAPKTGVHTLNGSSSSAVKKTPPIKRKDRGDGVRLGSSLDEESAVVEPASPAHKYRRTKAIHLTSKEDIGIQLAEAVSGTSTDRVGKFFRAATKSAVEHQYEMTLANARLSAALANKFEIHEVRTSQRAVRDEDAAAPVEMRVKFKESVRKWKEEVVTLLQPTELQAALKYILISGGETGKEMLKPFNMAQCSPRVFWSIARLYNGDVAAGLAALVPEEDWSYLDTRTRQISDKAKEAKANEEIYKQWKKHGSVLPSDVSTAASGRQHNNEVVEIGSDDDQEEKTATTSTNVRAAIASAEQAEKRSLREAAAQAALARLQTRVRAAEVAEAIKDHTSTHRPLPRRVDQDPDATESDEEDVEQTTTVYCDACGKARMLSLDEAETAGMGGGESDEQWTCARLTAVGRSGGCDELDDELAQIAGEKLGGRLQQQAQICTRQQLANADAGAATRLLAHPLDANYAEIKSTLEAMIDEARLDEVNDAIAEIVGGDEQLVGRLELQKLGTPADLVETPVDLIASAMETTVAEAEEWQRLARHKVVSSPWMGEWRTV